MTHQITDELMDIVKKEIGKNIQRLRILADEWLERPESGGDQEIVAILTEIHGCLVMLQQIRAAEIAQQLAQVFQKIGAMPSSLRDEKLENGAGMLAMALLILSDAVDEMGQLNEAVEANLKQAAYLLDIVEGNKKQADNRPLISHAVVMPHTWSTIAEHYTNQLDESIALIDRAGVGGIKQLRANTQKLLPMVDVLTLLNIPNVAQQFQQALTQVDQVDDEKTLIVLAGELLTVRNALTQLGLYGPVRTVGTADNVTSIMKSVNREAMVRLGREGAHSFSRLRKELISNGSISIDNMQDSAVVALEAEALSLLLGFKKQAQVLRYMAGYSLRLAKLDKIDEQTCHEAADLLVAAEFLFQDMQHCQSETSNTIFLSKSLKHVNPPLNITDMDIELSELINNRISDNDTDAFSDTDVLDENVLDELNSENNEYTENQEEQSTETGSIPTEETGDIFDLIKQRNLDALQQLTVPEDKIGFYEAEQFGDIDEEIREIFLEEFSELAVQLRDFYEQWRAGEQKILSDVRRVFHTLKGSGRMAQHEPLGEFAWRLESMLNHVLEREIIADEEVLTCVDHAVSLTALAAENHALEVLSPAMLQIAEIAEQCLNKKLGLGGSVVDDITGASDATDTADDIAAGMAFDYADDMAGTDNQAADTGSSADDFRADLEDAAVDDLFDSDSDDAAYTGKAKTAVIDELFDFDDATGSSEKVDIEQYDSGISDHADAAATADSDDDYLDLGFDDAAGGEPVDTSEAAGAVAGHATAAATADSDDDFLDLGFDDAAGGEPVDTSEAVGAVAGHATAAATADSDDDFLDLGFDDAAGGEPVDTSEAAGHATTADVIANDDDSFLDLDSIGDSTAAAMTAIGNDRHVGGNISNAAQFAKALAPLLNRLVNEEGTATLAKSGSASEVLSEKFAAYDNLESLDISELQGQLADALPQLSGAGRNALNEAVELGYAQAILGEDMPQRSVDSGHTGASGIDFASDDWQSVISAIGAVSRRSKQVDDADMDAFAAIMQAHVGGHLQSVNHTEKADLQADFASALSRHTGLLAAQADAIAASLLSRFTDKQADEIAALDEVEFDQLLQDITDRLEQNNIPDEALLNRFVSALKADLMLSADENGSLALDDEDLFGLRQAIHEALQLKSEILDESGVSSFLDTVFEHLTSTDDMPDDSAFGTENTDVVATGIHIEESAEADDAAGVVSSEIESIATDGATISGMHADEADDATGVVSTEAVDIAMHEKTAESISAVEVDDAAGVASSEIESIATDGTAVSGMYADEADDATGAVSTEIERIGTYEETIAEAEKEGIPSVGMAAKEKVVSSVDAAADSIEHVLSVDGGYGRDISTATVHKAGSSAGGADTDKPDIIVNAAISREKAGDAAGIEAGVVLTHSPTEYDDGKNKPGIALSALDSDAMDKTIADTVAFTGQVSDGSGTKTQSDIIDDGAIPVQSNTAIANAEGIDADTVVDAGFGVAASTAAASDSIRTAENNVQILDAEAVKVLANNRYDDITNWPIADIDMHAGDSHIGIDPESIDFFMYDLDDRVARIDQAVQAWQIDRAAANILLDTLNQLSFASARVGFNALAECGRQQESLIAAGIEHDKHHEQIRDSIQAMLTITKAAIEQYSLDPYQGVLLALARYAKAMASRVLSEKLLAAKSFGDANIGTEHQSVMEQLRAELQSMSHSRYDGQGHSSQRTREGTQDTFLRAVDDFEELTRRPETKLNPDSVSGLLESLYDIEETLASQNVPAWTWNLLDAVEQLLNEFRYDGAPLTSESTALLQESVELIEQHRQDEGDLHAMADREHQASRTIDQLMQGRQRRIAERPQQAQVSVPVKMDITDTDDSALAGSTIPAEHGQVDPHAGSHLSKVFCEEAQEILETSRNAQQEWAADHSKISAVSDLAKNIHTLRGSAGILEYHAIVEVADSLERLAGAICDGVCTDTAGAEKLLADGLADLSTMLECVRNGLLPAASHLKDQIDDFIADSSELKEDHAEAVEDIVSTDSEVSADAIHHDVEQKEETVEWDEDLLEIFTDEAQELLETVKEQLTRNIAESSVQNQIQRVMHTLKGGARMVGLPMIGYTAHLIESVVEKIPAMTQEQIDEADKLLHAGYEAHVAMLDSTIRREVPAAPNALNADLNTFIDELNGIHHSAAKNTGSDKVPDKSEEQVQVDDKKGKQPDAIKHINDTVEDKPTECAQATDEQDKQPDTGKDIVDKVEIITAAEQVKETAAKDNMPGKAKVKPGKQVRVSEDMLESLTTMVGEAGILRVAMDNIAQNTEYNLNELDRIAQRIDEQLRRLDSQAEAQILFRRENSAVDGDFDPLEMDRFSEMQQLSRQLAEAIDDLKNTQQTIANEIGQFRGLSVQQSIIHHDVQEKLMGAQLLRFDSYEGRLRRLVTQVAASVGKHVQLVIKGGQVEVERRLLDDLLAPLEHIIRNAIAHGIETPEERVAAGKTEQGVVKLDIRSMPNELQIRVIDDGRGLDYDKIRKSARKKGWLDEDRANDEEYLNNLLMRAGMSTSESVNQLSGRGVGLDVVNDMMKHRRGQMNIRTIVGHGTEFYMSMPSGMSIVDVLMVASAGDIFAIPMGSITSVAQLDSKQVELVRGGESVKHMYRGRPYPLVSLGRYLAPDYELPKGMDTLPGLIINLPSGETGCVFQIDRVVNRLEVVIKDIQRQTSVTTGIMGATVMADGRVLPVMDMVSLARRIETIAPVEPIGEVEEHPARILIVDDSVTMRKVGMRLLTRNGYEVGVAKDGLDALEILPLFEPDLILLDIEMPRMDGFEFAHQLRAQERFAKTPVVMITSRTGEKHRAKAAEAGVNNYLGKPYKEEELLSVINTLLEKQG